jgi:hypothetical protein
VRLRRKLFEINVDRRNAASKYRPPIKALVGRLTRFRSKTPRPLVDAFSSREPASTSLENAMAYSLAICVDAEWKIPAPETCDAIRKATTTAGTLISLKNWSTESIVIPPKRR